MPNSKKNVTKAFYAELTWSQRNTKYKSEHQLADRGQITALFWVCFFQIFELLIPMSF